MKKSIAVLVALAVALISRSSEPTAQSARRVATKASIPTFSTEMIGRQGHFYVGGKYEGDPGKEIMRGAMYVEVWVPKNIRYPYPVLFITGSFGQNSYPELVQTPDGRPGWAFDFVNQGYTVYIMDYPARGRSAYIPGVDGTIAPPRTAALMEEVWTDTPEMGTWPQAKKQTQWPGAGPNKGKKGDPWFDAFARTEVQNVTGPGLEKVTVDALVELVDLISQPVILLLHSGASPYGWLVADARPKSVKGIIAAEPVAPPMQNAERGSTGPGRLWGLTNSFIHYDPSIKEASELQTVRQDKADGPDLIPCWVQREPARKLVNLQGIPVLNVSGEASYHRPYAHCVAKWLDQAGVKTTFVKLEDVGLPGNGHQFMSEKNSAGIAKFFMGWLEKNVH